MLIYKYTVGKKKVYFPPGCEKNGEACIEMTKITEIFAACGISISSSVPFSACRIINSRKAEGLDFTPLSVCIGAVPYYPKGYEGGSVSVYAVSEDYHIFVNLLGKRITSLFQSIYKDRHIKIFGDNSPIDEVDAAARAGIGVIGRNRLLITEKYSSFVFLFEAITDLEPEHDAISPAECESCGRCVAACPSGMDMQKCISSLTQKKGALTDEERRLIIESGSLWGCDICQNVCPHTLKAIEKGTIYTDIPWFGRNIIASPTPDDIADDEFFSSRAYSWRGKKTILRNMQLFDAEKNSDQLEKKV